MVAVCQRTEKVHGPSHQALHVLLKRELRRNRYDVEVSMPCMHHQITQPGKELSPSRPAVIQTKSTAGRANFQDHDLTGAAKLVNGAATLCGPLSGEMP